MTCPSCSASVERLIDELDGITARNINHVIDSGIISFDEKIVSEAQIISKINEGHYKVETNDKNIEVKSLATECPACKKSGQMVPNTVFKSNLKPESINKINFDEKNYICLSPICEVAYYGKNFLIYLNELKRPLWYKKSSKKKIICYCNNIDKQQIKEAISEHQLSSWEEITSHYRKKVIEKCETLNPTGLCCRSTFDKVVNKIKQS